MFIPDYNNILDCAYNRKPSRIPLYEHNIDVSILERTSEKKFAHLWGKDLDGFFKYYCDAQYELGYDCITFEGCISEVLPNGGALSNSRQGHIDSLERLNDYPWHTVKDLYIKKFKPWFDALRRQMPKGMKAIGGVGNGIFENVQDLCGFEGLCIIKYDEPELYSGLYVKVADMMYGIWEWFLAEYSDLYCVVRFGDDLGYKSSTMLPPEDIRKHIIPQYKRFTDLSHKYNRPFLLHSCGNILNVMDDIIDKAGINAKHSNEDQIAHMNVWVDKYGDRIGNFGGIDTDHLVQMPDDALEESVKKIYSLANSKNGGFAIGSGNSIPYYVNPDKYLLMINTIRKLRGD